ncbi:MAG: ribonuclease PH [bacterium]|nr:ribonuclease PH [bacterium]
MEGWRGREADQLRPIRIVRGYTDTTPGSVLIEMGRTRVLATASVTDSVPRWMKRSGRGWVTGEYAMLPGSGHNRIPRSAYNSGRPKEISRLIGRSLRAVVDLNRLDEITVNVDCDVIQADGGTRTAAINAGWVALHDALQWAEDKGKADKGSLLDRVTAISVGLVKGQALLDLDYRDDMAASVDLNVVMTGRGLMVEVQGTAEQLPFSRAELDELLNLAEPGIEAIGDLQEQAISE